MTPLEFVPILKRRRWGGRRLGTVLGKPIGDGDDWGESWEIADHGEDQSRVADGPYKGRPLNQLLAEQGTELLGRHQGLGQFPLLVKYLDAHDRLSVQVHPDDDLARRFNPEEYGKTEAWVVLQAEPGGCVYAGLKEGIDRNRLNDALAAGSVEDCLHRVDVQLGDCLYLPAGTVHALGEGLLLAEIQQSSDLTFRLYDWGRLDQTGHPRPLHIEEALQCIDFGRGPVNPVSPRPLTSPLSGRGERDDGPHRVEELVRSEFFVMHRHRAAEPFTMPHDGRFHILMSLSGEAELVCGEDSRSVQAGGTVLLPASAERARLVPTDGELLLLDVFLP